MESGREQPSDRKAPGAFGGLGAQLRGPGKGAEQGQRGHQKDGKHQNGRYHGEKGDGGTRCPGGKYMVGRRAAGGVQAGPAPDWPWAGSGSGGPARPGEIAHPLRRRGRGAKPGRPRYSCVGSTSTGMLLSCSSCAVMLRWNNSPQKLWCRATTTSMSAFRRAASSITPLTTSA